MISQPTSKLSATNQSAESKDLPAVLITGASGGIGHAVSLAFSRIGWYVGVHYCQDKAAAETTLREVVASGSTGHLYQADVRQSVAVQRMVNTLCARVRNPSALICNAGIGPSNLMMYEQNDVWADVLATNLTGTFHCLRAMAPVLFAHGGGSIVVVGSHTGFHGAAGAAAYSASKAGLIGLVKTAALEWGGRNVRVNLVLPGWQKTRLTDGVYPEEGEWFDHALRRPPAIEEAAHTIVYLAQLNDVSGQVWNCDSRNL